MLIKPRWRKVARDILANKARTVLVVLAIAVGVFAFGSVFTTQDVLLRDMNKGFVSTNPANIIVSMSPFDESLLRTVRTFDGVSDAEARATAQVNVRNGDQWTAMSMIAVPDFERLEIGRINLEEGTLTPERREIMMERRSMLPLTSAAVGDTLTIELSDGTLKEIELVGVVHDFNAIPGNLFPQLTGYVTLDTLRQFGLSDQYSELHIIADPEYDTAEELEALSNELQDTLDRYGYQVGFVDVQQSDEHWAADLVQALVTVLGAIGFLALALSGFLVINTVTAILAQQKRQIGMMKAVGARGVDVLGIYTVMAVVFGILSLFVALPVGTGIAYGLSQALGFVLNVNVTSFRLPAWVIGLQVLTAVVTPLMAAFIPIAAGTRITVREAVSDYGIGTSAEAKGIGAAIGRFIDNVINGLITAIRGLPRPTKLSLRNTFRRKVRLGLTLATLSVAGAIFVAVINVRGSLLAEFDQILALFGYDAALFLTEPQPVSRLQREAGRVDGVNRVEGWGFAAGTLLGDGDDEIAEFTIFAPPADTPFIDPNIIEGRWLQEGDTNAIVIASEVMRDLPGISVGDEIRVDLGPVERRMELVGIVNLVGIDFAYADFDYITRAQGAAGQSFAAIVGMEQSTLRFQTDVGRAVEERYKDSGIGVGGTQTTQSLIGGIQQQVNVIVGFMLFMAILLAVVGGLGLASTMSLNVLERTREIGVMRAIGASDGGVRGIFLTEGLVIGVMSFAVACVLSLPISRQFAVAIGNSFFERPLETVLVPGGFGIWFVIVMLIAALASLLPSNRAAQVSVRESLAYE